MGHTNVDYKRSGWIKAAAAAAAADVGLGELNAEPGEQLPSKLLTLDALDGVGRW